MKISKSELLPSPFFNNFFCLIPKTNLAFVAISKNGVTFLKNVALYNERGYWPKSFNESHDLIGYNSKSPFLIPVKEMADYEIHNGKLIKFAIWRDPIERIESTYKLFCLTREFRLYFFSLGLYNDTSFERFMDFIRFEWGKTNPVYQDEHIRRQVDYYHFSDVDYIININKMYQFLKNQNVKFFEEKSNRSEESFRIKDKKIISEIEEYYKADYEIKSLCV